ncbi:tetratricopeptide repeat protein [Empedobacter tilapiae]|uniref:Sel1 repeat family protein n=1 Tax=Empedobacter tilapiae TaxID=2491114 RepID=A0A4Z1B492_9FLAO|nr:tetratricopeptide repeat protein [Empedobacter tilapiae]TGN22534.1 sel1 repeat family protein [Empedobacter tilapiae]
MKKLYTFLILIFAFTFAQAQNDIKARIEFEEAEKAFTEENYETALKHLNQTEKELGRWTPNVSYLKIESLYSLTDMGNFEDPNMQPLYEEVTKYMAYLNKLKSDDVPMEKYKVVYGIEKTLKVLKIDEPQSPEFLKAKKEHDAKNYDAAIPLYEKLAKQGNSWAMRNLGLVYETKKDNEKAKEWYQKAAQMGHPRGFYFLGWYADKDGNTTKALEYYQQAVDLGDVAGLLGIGDLYKQGKSVTKDYKKAEEYYKKAAVKDRSEAMYKIGTLYHNGGNGIAQNHKTAMEWYLKAAEKKNTNAMGEIGWIYQHGQGDYAKDYKKAAEWYQKRIDYGDNYGFLNLGDLYSLSDNSQSQKELESYEKAAEAGYLKGMLETANLYFSGKGGITKDYAKAAKYYEEYYNDKKENESYINNLIEIYNRGGNGIEKDKEKAKYWKEIRRK